jgi:steroid 5-alpha reductase family enzyme
MPDDFRKHVRDLLDTRLGKASTSVVSLLVYALALGLASWAVGLTPQPMLAALAGMVAATLVVFAAATLLGNASLYDPFWSVAPPVLLIWLLVAEGAAGSREAIVFAAVSVWAVRLTWNCMARWQHLSDEDFRYRDLRDKTGRWFPLVNLAGIELFPTLLVFLGCLPLFAVAGSARPLGLLDLAAALLVGAAIAIETVADRQLRAHKRTGKHEILTTGVWGWSQHPNYLGEIAFWWALFLFGLSAGAPLWTGVGALAMTALFWFVSIPLMLARKRARHPGYDEAVNGIAVLVPGVGKKESKVATPQP